MSPPLTIPDEELDRFLEILTDVLTGWPPA
jgi:4-aminobutyrate aminotransferase-like enzyme